MAVSDCYINQHDPAWSDLYLDDNQRYSVYGYGCIVCCAAMCISHRLGYGLNDKTLKKAAIEKVIADCCTSDGDFLYDASTTHEGEYFHWIRTDTTPDMYGWPIVYYTGSPHAVLYTDPWTVLDPANEDCTTATQADSDYFGPKSYWPH